MIKASVFHDGPIEIRVDERFETTICEVCQGLRTDCISTSLHVSEPYKASGLAFVTGVFVMLGVGFLKYIIWRDRLVIWLGCIKIWIRSPIRRIRIEWQEPIVIEPENQKNN